MAKWPAMNTSTRPRAEPRSAYKVFREIATRWSDTGVNGLLMEQSAIDIHSVPLFGLVLETGSNHFTPRAFPGAVVAGARSGRAGISNVCYEDGNFAAGDDDECAAGGHFVHVHFDRLTRRPPSLPTGLLFVLDT
jgi:acyl-CoA thioester hydrolase